MPTAHLLTELEELRGEGWSVETSDADGWALVLISNYSVPPGFTCVSTDLLLKLPISYPNGRPDMFWVQPDLLLANGAVPRQANVLESYLGRQWRRFSWHPQGWNPGRDSLRTYLEFVNARLGRAE